MSLSSTRNVVRYRPVEPNTVVDIPPWVRFSSNLRPVRSSLWKRGRVWLLSSRSSWPLATRVVLGMCVALLLILSSQLIAGWVNLTYNSWNYGFPRTFQTDAYVGHDEISQPSHFIAINNRGLIEVIEFPGNDASRARIFLGPRLSGASTDLFPVTLQFVDPHHTHHPDMLVSFGSTTLLYLNQGGTFHLSSGSTGNR